MNSDPLWNGSSDGSTGSSHSPNSSLDSSLISVNVTNSEVWEKSKKFTVYKLSVTCGGKSWQIYRRYNEFSKLYDTLKKEVRGTRLKLPGKKLFGNNFGTDFIRSRRQGLDEFVKRLMSDDRLNKRPEVRSFLGLTRLQANSSGSSDHEELDSNYIDSVSDSQAQDSITCSTNAIVDLGPLEKTQAKPSDFEFLKVIGKGSFGKVLLAKHKLENQTYAVKVLQKNMILKRNERTHIMCERNVLLKNLSHPFLVGLHYSFQTRDKLYFVLDYVNGGELFFHLQRERCFSESRARFYTAELTLALGYLHSEGIVYRDLKPENILLDADGHILLTDFGLCKDGLQERDTTSTFCGTPEYLAPEVLRKEAYDWSVDWWCLGAVLYEMLYGLPPFYSRDTAEMYDNILHKPVKLRTNISLAARSILEALLQKDKKRRLGSRGDSEEVKKDPFFASINWIELVAKNVLPPFNPEVKNCFDMRNIDPEFTRESVPASVCRSSGYSITSSIPDNAFQGFSYVDPGLLNK